MILRVKRNRPKVCVYAGALAHQQSMRPSDSPVAVEIRPKVLFEAVEEGAKHLLRFGQLGFKARYARFERRGTTALRADLTLLNEIPE